jgi:DNA-binding winged helix-turn-helix (wHTH) protein
MPETINSSQSAVVCYRLGDDFVLNTHINTLTHANGVVELEHRLVLLLVYFIEHAGEILHKDVILKTIWQGKVVNEDSLAVAVSYLRKALGDNSRSPRFIKTIQGKGYQFIGKASPLADGSDASLSFTPPQSPFKKYQLSLTFLAVLIVVVGGYMYKTTAIDVASVKSSDAYSADWQASYQTASALLSQPDPESWRLAIKAFRDVLNQNSESAEAYLGIADAKMKLLNEKLALKENCVEVLGLLQKALSLKPDLAAAHRTMANATFWCQRDYPLAEQHYLTAIKLNPKDDSAFMDYAQLLLAQKRFEESLMAVESARRINPINYSVPNVVWIYQMQGRDDLALRELDRILTTEPDNRYYHISAKRIFDRMGDVEKTFAQWVWLMRDAGFTAEELNEAQQAFSQGGLVAFNRWLLTRKTTAELSEYTPPLAWARYALVAKEYDVALDYLEAAYAQRQSPMLWAGVDPAYEPVRNTPRFQKILAQLNEAENK